MLLLFLLLSFLSSNIAAGQHGPMDPPVVPQHLLRNRRATAPATTDNIQQLRNLIRQYEHQRTLVADDPEARIVIDTRIRSIRDDIRRLQEEDNDFTKISLTPHTTRMLCKTVEVGIYGISLLFIYRAVTNDPTTK